MDMRLIRSGRAHADGVLPSANVPRPSGSSFISLRGVPRRRAPDAQRSIGRHHRCVHVHRAAGASRSEIKEEPKAGDIRGGKYPLSCARAPTSNNPSQT